MKAQYIVAVGVCIVLTMWCGSMGCEKSSDSPFDNENGSDSDSDADGDSDADNDIDDDSGFNDDDDDDDDLDSESGEVCEEEVIDIIPKLSRVMVLQDISGSMVEENGVPVEKWNQARAAITNLAEKFELEVDLGLDFFSDNGTCGVDAPVTSDTVPENAQNIINSLNAAQPAGFTPLYLAMTMFTDAGYAPEFTSDQAESYLLVVSDGRDTCGKNGDPFSTDEVLPADLAEITTTLLNEHDIKTFVIGFGDGVEPDELNAIAANGGTEFTEYLVADDQQSLEEALETIISTLVSCIYELEITEPNVDPTEVNFYFVTLDDDGNEVKEVVPYDEDCNAGIGWHWVDFDNFIVEFCEEACATLQTGEVIKIIAEFGCEVIVV